MNDWSLSQVRESSDTEALITVFREAFTKSVEWLRLAAAAYCRLKSLGEPVPVSSRMGAIFERIEAGQLSPAFVWKTQGNALLYSRCHSLPVSVQERIAAGDPFRLLSDAGRERTVPALEMDGDQLRQVFARTRERSDAEQISFRERSADAVPDPEKAEMLMEVDCRRQLVCFYRPCKVPRQVLEQLLEQLNTRRRKRKSKS